MPPQLLYHLAKRYGKALFEAVAKPQACQHLWEEWLRLQDVVKNDPKGWRVLVSPLLSQDQRNQVVKSLAEKLSLSPLLQNFLKIVVKHNRLKSLSAIMESFQKERETQAGKKQGTLTTPTPLPAAQVQEMEQLLTEKMGYSLILTPQVDPALLGGAIVSWEGFQIDGSLATELDILSQRLQQGI